MEVVLFKVRTRSGIDEAAYEQVFEHLLEVVSDVPGFVGIEGFTGEDGSELAVVRFTSRAIEAWRDHPDHVAAQQRGREEFFARYDITIATEWRSYDWSVDDG